jgi:hypothetical protein
LPKAGGFALVEAIARTLPDVDVSIYWGQPALKAKGQMLVCMASHSSAEPNTLVVRMAIPDRDALVEEEPETYYLKDHYVGYPCVLVRLSKVHRDALRGLILGALRFVSTKAKAKPRARPKTKAT